jgi:hypothetical protein
MISIDATISIDGFRYVHVMSDDPQGLDSTPTGPLGSREGQDASLAAAWEYLAALERDPDCDELALVVARHEVMRRRRALADEIAREDGQSAD